MVNALRASIELWSTWEFGSATHEARVLLLDNSYASLMLSQIPTCSITWWTNAKCWPFLKYGLHVLQLQAFESENTNWMTSSWWLLIIEKHSHANYCTLFMIILGSMHGLLTFWLFVHVSNYKLLLGHFTRMTSFNLHFHIQMLVTVKPTVHNI